MDEGGHAIVIVFRQRWMKAKLGGDSGEGGAKRDGCGMIEVPVSTLLYSLQLQESPLFSLASLWKWLAALRFSCIWNAGVVCFLISGWGTEVEGIERLGSERWKGVVQGFRSVVNGLASKGNC